MFWFLVLLFFERAMFVRARFWRARQSAGKAPKSKAFARTNLDLQAHGLGPAAAAAAARNAVFVRVRERQHDLPRVVTSAAAVTSAAVTSDAADALHEAKEVAGPRAARGRVGDRARRRARADPGGAVGRREAVVDRGRERERRAERAVRDPRARGLRPIGGAVRLQEPKVGLCRGGFWFGCCLFCVVLVVVFGGAKASWGVLVCPFLSQPFTAPLRPPLPALRNALSTAAAATASPKSYSAPSSRAQSPTAGASAAPAAARAYHGSKSARVGGK